MDIQVHPPVELRCPLFPRKRTLSGNLCGARADKVIE